MTLPRVVWPYSLYYEAGDTVYLSGQIGLDPETLKLEYGIAKQTQRACENIKAVCEEAGVSMDQVVKTTIFLTDIQDYERVNGIYGSYFPHNPARSCVAVSELPAGAIVEIEVIVKK